MKRHDEKQQVPDVDCGQMISNNESRIEDSSRLELAQIFRPTTPNVRSGCPIRPPNESQITVLIKKKNSRPRFSIPLLRFPFYFIYFLFFIFSFPLAPFCNICQRHERSTYQAHSLPAVCLLPLHGSLNLNLVHEGNV